MAPGDLRAIDFQYPAYQALRRFDELERALQRRMVLQPHLHIDLELAMARAKKNNDGPSYLGF